MKDEITILNLRQSQPNNHRIFTIDCAPVMLIAKKDAQGGFARVPFGKSNEANISGRPTPRANLSDAS
jgi:hypothetical protein